MNANNVMSVLGNLFGFLILVYFTLFDRFDFSMLGSMQTLLEQFMLFDFNVTITLTKPPRKIIAFCCQISKETQLDIARN